MSITSVNLKPKNILYLIIFWVACITGYPLHRENRENDQINSLSGKTQGIWFAQVINSLILKVKDI